MQIASMTTQSATMGTERYTSQGGKAAFVESLVPFLHAL